MGRAGGNVRTATCAEVVSLCASGQCVVVAGVNGSGKSTLLREVAAALHASGISVHPFRGAEAEGHRRIADAAPDAVVIVDDFEQASAEIVRACLTRAARGGRTVFAVLDGPQRSRPLHELTHDHTAADSLHTVWNACTTVRLDALPPDTLERLLHAHSSEPIDADTSHSVIRLAEGRPGWAFDLLRLARRGLISSTPRPTIRDAPLPADELPALRSLAAALGDLAPESAGAAIALSGLEPFDLSGARDLIGSARTAELTDHGVLFRVPGTESFTVPTFVATALRTSTTPELIARWQRTIAEHWVQQEALSLPLSEAEAMLSARSLSTDPADQEDERLRAARVRILHRAATESVEFHDPAHVRTLVVRAGRLATPLTGCDHVRAVYVLAGAELAHTELEALRNTGGAVDPFVTEWNAALFAAEAGQTATTTAVPAESAASTPSDLAGARLVFHMWNQTERPDVDSIEFRNVVDNHSVAEVRHLGRALIDLQAVWEGHLPQGSWIANGLSIPSVHDHSSEFGRSVSGTLLLAHALIAFLAGEQSLRAEEFRAAVRRVPRGEAHARWMRHLLAMGEAVICGNMARGAMEWEHLLQTIPRTVPLRLRALVQHMGLAAGAAYSSDTEDPPSNLPSGVHLYFSGKHDKLGLGGRPDIAPQNTLPMVRLVSAHLRAAAEQNPSDLLRVAARLRKLQLWAPAAFAISSARTIFLNRRAVRNVRDCDELLADIDEQLGARVPWYQTGDLPTVTLVRLTPREHTSALLAAEGLTNAQIAERLSCSVRTVESHVSQAKAKLGAVTRADLRKYRDMLRSSPSGALPSADDPGRLGHTPETSGSRWENRARTPAPPNSSALSHGTTSVAHGQYSPSQI